VIYFKDYFLVTILEGTGNYLDSCREIGYPRWGFLKNFSTGTIAVSDSEYCRLWQQEVK